MKSDRLQKLRDENLAAREILCVAFPQTFAGKGKPKRPLKIGIFHDIAALGTDVSKRCLRNALRDYTSGPLYLKAVKEGEPRIDLDGYTAGFVTAEHAAHAEERLAAINARKSRKAHRKPSDERIAA